MLANDDYYLHTIWEPLGLGSELYDDVLCLNICRDPAFVFANATVVTVLNTDRPDIDFDLEVPPGGMISGRGTDADIGILPPEGYRGELFDNGDPVPNYLGRMAVQLFQLFDADGNPIGGSETNSAGQYI